MTDPSKTASLFGALASNKQASSPIFSSGAESNLPSGAPAQGQNSSSISQLQKPQVDEANSVNMKKQLRSVADLELEMEQIQKEILKYDEALEAKTNELVKLVTDEANAIKTRIKAESRKKYLEDNKAEDPQAQEQIHSLSISIRNAKITLGELQRKKQALEKETEEIDELRERELKKKNHLKEPLAYSQRFQQLRQLSKEVNQSISQSISKYQTCRSCFAQQYREAKTAQIQGFLFEDLNKKVKTIKKLYQKRKSINRQICEMQFKQLIQTKEDIHEFDVELFADGESFAGYCEFLLQEQVNPLEKKKQILMSLLENDSQFTDFLKRVKAVKIYQESQRLERQKRELEEKKKREEQQRLEKIRQEELQKQREEEQRKRQLQREGKQRKLNQYLSKIEATNKKISQSEQQVKQIDIKQKEGLPSMQKALTEKKDRLSLLRQLINELDRTLTEASALFNELGKDQELASLQGAQHTAKTAAQNDSIQLDQLQTKVKLIAQKEKKQRQEARQRKLEKTPDIKLTLFEQDIEKMAVEQQLGPQTKRFLKIQQLYLNQLRIIIQLRTVSTEQLEAFNFDAKSYKKLVTRKTEILQKCQFPTIISDEILQRENYQTILSQMQKIQAQLAPLQAVFDQKYIKELFYKYPKQMLEKTKQELFEAVQTQKIKAYEQELQKIKSETAQMNQLIRQAEAKKQRLQDEEKELIKKEQNRFEEYKNEASKQLFINVPDEGKILEIEPCQLEYKVVVANQQSLSEMYETLKDESKLKAVKEKLQEVNRQRQRAKQAYENSLKDYADEKNRNKDKRLKEVYLGDWEKVKRDAKVHELQQDLKKLKEKWASVINEKNRRHSREIQGSQFRIVSRIEEF